MKKSNLVPYACSALAVVAFIACGKPKDDSNNGAPVRAAGNGNPATPQGKPNVSSQPNVASQPSVASQPNVASQPGVASQPNQASGAEVIPEIGFLEKKMALNESVTMKIKTGIVVDSVPVVEIVEAQCLGQTEEVATRQLQAGVFLLGKSRASVMQDTSTKEGKEKPVLVMTCTSEKTGELDLKELGGRKIAKRTLVKGKAAISEPMVLSMLDGTKKSGNISINCAGILVQTSVNSTGGVTLTVGSSMIVMRDLGIKLTDGSEAKNLAPMAFIECVNEEVVSQKESK